MATIRVYTDFSERNNQHYYEDAYICDTLPKIEFNSIGEILEEARKPFHGSLYYDGAIFSISNASIDCENDSEAFNYNYYRVYRFDYETYLDDLLDYEESEIDIDDYISEQLIAVPIENED